MTEGVIARQFKRQLEYEIAFCPIQIILPKQ